MNAIPGSFGDLGHVKLLTTVIYQTMAHLPTLVDAPILKSPFREPRVTGGQHPDVGDARTDEILAPSGFNLWPKILV
jgi:hypothetical protein